MSLHNAEVRIETTNACNAACVMCPREKMDRLEGAMSMDLFRRIVSESKALGAERVLYGTDYPADMANHQNCREIPGMSRLEEKQQNQILIENVRKLYQIT